MEDRYNQKLIHQYGDTDVVTHKTMKLEIGSSCTWGGEAEDAQYAKEDIQQTTNWQTKGKMD